VKPRVAILISGRGSNMAALIAAAALPDYPAQMALVVADRADAAGLALAAQAGLATATIPSQGRPREAFEAELQALLAEHRTDFIALAGFMRVLTPAFVQAWEGRMVNIHPSLLPSFPGLHTHARALAAGVRLHGCTVHLVSTGVDEGPILAQAAVPVLEGDTEEALAARVLVQEHLLYAAALAWLVAGHAWMEEGRLVVAAPAATGALANPLPEIPGLPTHAPDAGKV
jgi:formyltetrahydrofolate-dependent phosphoribosylglycinamide formyltransferase